MGAAAAWGAAVAAVLALLPLALAREAAARVGGGGEDRFASSVSLALGDLGEWARDWGGTGLPLPDLELAAGSPRLLAGAGLLTGAAAAAGVAALLWGQGAEGAGKVGGGQAFGGGKDGRFRRTPSGAAASGRAGARGPAAKPGPAIVGDGVDAVPEHMSFDTAREFFTWSADATPAGSVCSFTSSRSRDGKSRGRRRVRGSGTSQTSDGGGENHAGGARGQGGAAVSAQGLPHTVGNQKRGSRANQPEESPRRLFGCCRRRPQVKHG